jgi:hypothetical protein
MPATKIVLTDKGDVSATIEKVTAAMKQMQADGAADAGIASLKSRIAAAVCDSLSQPGADEEVKARLLCDLREELMFARNRWLWSATGGIGGQISTAFIGTVFLTFVCASAI